MRRLHRFRYEETGAGADQWELERLTFGKFNLVTGRNATGKTRLLKSIARLAFIIEGDPGPHGKDAEWEVELTNGHVAGAEFAIVEGRVRELPAGVDLPAFSAWAKSLQYLQFGGRMDLRWPPGEGNGALGLADVYQAALTEYGRDFERAVLDTVHEAGYSLSSIVLRQKMVVDAPILEVLEPKRHAFTPAARLSQGQRRALTLAVFLRALEASGKPATVLVDDFGEGLDFERAGRFAEVLLGFADSPIQLILATNDRYVMNVVPLEYWSVLVEEESVTRVFNQENSRARFEEFKFTGLSNFDFFSMDFATGDVGAGELSDEAGAE